jgi:hypothetical protein
MSTLTLTPAAAASAPMVTSWCRTGCSCGRERGGATRAQMRLFALNVAVALVGRAACVHCDAPVSLHTGQVDRTDPGECYRPGFVIMTCDACNNALGQTDMSDNMRAKYIADVLRASLKVSVPGQAEAKRIYAVKPTMRDQLRKSPYME